MQTGNYTSSSHEYIHIIAAKVDIPEQFLFFLFARNFFFLNPTLAVISHPPLLSS